MQFTIMIENENSSNRKPEIKPATVPVSVHGDRPSSPFTNKHLSLFWTETRPERGSPGRREGQSRWQLVLCAHGNRRTSVTKPRILRLLFSSSSSVSL